MKPFALLDTWPNQLISFLRASVDKDLRLSHSATPNAAVEIGKGSCHLLIVGLVTSVLKDGDHRVPPTCQLVLISFYV